MISPTQSSTKRLVLPAPRTLLITIAGSRAHGTARSDSDTDLRTVYLETTRAVLSVRKSQESREKIKDCDENSWELGRFLSRAVKGSPSVLETLLGPVHQSSPEGDELRSLFSHLLCRDAVRGAFWGFAQNEKHQMLSQTSGRRVKARASYLQVLFNAIQLHRTGCFNTRIVDTPIGPTILDARNGLIPVEKVLELGKDMEAELNQAGAKGRSVLPEEPDHNAIDEFLWRVRLDPENR